jgi:succinate dehydrogenase hydrophobic anchor subunit
VHPLTLQYFGGLALAALVAWQLSTGLRWIRLGPKHYTIHRITGITLAVLVLPHLALASFVTFGWFAPLFRPVFGL